jgi:hypothetical protein
MDNPSTARAHKLALQAKWLNQRMVDNDRWTLDMPSPRVVKVSDRKTFIAWRRDAAGKVEVVDMLRVNDVEISFTRGITVKFSAGATSNTICITAHPREIVPGVFAWIPPHAELRYGPHNPEDATSRWRLTLPMLVRQMTTSSTVLSTLKEFQDLHPNISL